MKKILVGAACLASSASMQAFAGGPLANCGSSDGQPYLWPNGGVDIPFNPDQGGLGPLSNAEAVALVQSAFQQWGDVPTSTASYTNAGALPVDVDTSNFFFYLSSPAPDGQSAIVFDDTGEIFNFLYGPGSGILGFAGPEWVNPTTCEISEGLSFLNGPAFTDTTYAFDVMVHEFGHYSNLAHTVVNGQILLGDTSGPNPDATTFGSLGDIDDVETMYPFYFGVGTGTGTLAKDDAASLSVLYPEPGYLESTATISGTIYDSDGSSPLTGVNVIARNIADPFGDAVSAISSDSTDSSVSPFAGTYAIEGLTPGADYLVFIDEILAGGFSTTTFAFLGRTEEYYNGSGEGSEFDDPLQYTPVSAAAGATASDIDVILNFPAPNTPLNLGDDGSIEVRLPFTYSLCGAEYDTVNINANGNLTFNNADYAYSDSAQSFLNFEPRIAGLWTDLNLNAGGQIYFSQSGSEFTAHYDNVPEYASGGGGAGANSFAITLSRSSDHVDIKYGNVSATSGLAGISCGNSFTSTFEAPTDLSSYGKSRINMQRSAAIYEQFDASGSGQAIDLANSTVRFNGSMDYNDNWAESNDSMARARKVSLPFDSKSVVRYTEIEPAGADVDYFSFTAEQGTSIVADIVAGGGFGFDLDTIMALFDSSGNMVAFDDDSGAGILSKIIYPVPSTGTYYLAVSTYGDDSFTGEGNGQEGRYTLDLSAVDGKVLTFPRNTSSVGVDLPFAFPFQGQSYSSMYVNSSGNITFGGGDTWPYPWADYFVSGLPRIAGFWYYLRPNFSGLVTMAEAEGSVTITFKDVPEYPFFELNTFAMTLFEDGTVKVVYGDVADDVDVLVGLTPGNGAADPGEVDLSSSTAWPLTGTTYEYFFDKEVDLDGKTLTFKD